MATNIKYANELVSIIKGYELGIIQILEKWKVSEKDIEVIQDRIALIQQRTVELYVEKNEYDDYMKKFGYKKSQRKYDRKYVEQTRHKKIFQVFKNGKLVGEGTPTALSEAFGIHRSQLSKIKDKKIIKGYEIVLKEVKS